MKYVSQITQKFSNHYPLRMTGLVADTKDEKIDLANIGSQIARLSIYGPIQIGSNANAIYCYHKKSAIESVDRLFTEITEKAEQVAHANGQG